ncbi:hypothetical protein DB346_23550 [Verrucomicrobia bacterium LW23]|nr:hypothetical protein DB346_23550 [Verrucomicrobia bacterium LW23]
MTTVPPSQMAQSEAETEATPNAPDAPQADPTPAPPPFQPDEEEDPSPGDRPAATRRTPRRREHRTLRARISSAIIFVGVIVTVVAVFVSYYSAQSAIGSASFDQLSSVRVLLKDSVENYFTHVRNDLATQAQSMTTIAALEQFTAARRNLTQDLSGQGFTLDDTRMRPIREKLRAYYNNVLLENLKRAGQVPGSADSYLIRGDDGMVLQYIYTVANPATVGSKDESSLALNIRSYPEAGDSELRFAISGTTYVQTHDRFHPMFQDIRRRMGYYDIFLVDEQGNVVYTNMKELDFQGNLLDGGSDANTGLGIAYRASRTAGLDSKAADRLRLTDMAPYAKSYNAPAMFAAAPVYSSGKRIGAIIVQLPVDYINNLVTFLGREKDIKLGGSGEAYLVGQDGKLRTNSRNPKAPGKAIRHYMSADGRTVVDTSIGAQEVNTRATSSALAGQSGDDVYANYLNQQVLGSWAPISIAIASTASSGNREVPLQWSLLVEKAQSEAYSPVYQATLYIAAAGLAIVLVVVIIASVISQRIAAPIVALREAMHRVTQGDESARAPVFEKDEIGDLATSFNELVTERNAVKDKIADENKRLQANIQELLMVVADASDGNLGIRAKVTEGALGNMADALNLMLENVGGLMANAKKASTRVAEASASISSASRELADGAQQQSTKITQTTDGARSLSAESARVLETCREAAQAAREAQAAAERGAVAVRSVMAGMARIRENTQGNARKIKRLGERSMEISGIVRSISDISAQTDMLALNASIEAARAGEQGKGFTVVADQVRALAERTKAATLEIERLVLGIQSETSEAVSQMEAQTQEVEAGSGKVEQAGGALEAIVASSTLSSRLVGQISQSATAQATRAEEMLKTVATVQDITRASQAKVLETRKSSEQMASLSQDLTKELAQFNLG